MWCKWVKKSNFFLGVSRVARLLHSERSASSCCCSEEGAQVVPCKGTAEIAKFSLKMVHFYYFHEKQLQQKDKLSHGVAKRCGCSASIEKGCAPCLASACSPSTLLACITPFEKTKKKLLKFINIFQFKRGWIASGLLRTYLCADPGIVDCVRNIFCQCRWCTGVCSKQIERLNVARDKQDVLIINLEN